MFPMCKKKIFEKNIKKKITFYLCNDATFWDQNWKNRRSQKLEKMELLNLQSNLQSEIQAKQEISQELSKIRSDLEASRK